MDILELSLAGIMAVGAVNVLNMFKPMTDSRVKFALAFVVALIVSFVPADLSSQLLEKVKTAIEIALTSTGMYKLATKVSGK